MRLNSWDISEANATQWNVIHGYSKIKNLSEWDVGAVAPAFHSVEVGLKPLKVTVLVKGENRDEIRNNISTVISKCLGRTKIELDGDDHYYVGTLNKHSVTVKSLHRWHDLTLEFLCVEYGQPIVIKNLGSSVKNFVVENPGNFLTPVSLQFTVKQAVSNLNIYNLSHSYNYPFVSTGTISVLSCGQNDVVHIDGIDKRFYKNQYPYGVEEFEVWELPTIYPGRNQIVFSEEVMGVNFEFNPVFV